MVQVQRQVQTVQEQVQVQVQVQMQEQVQDLLRRSRNFSWYSHTGNWTRFLNNKSSPK